MTELTITAKRDGFRRCGVIHSDKPVVWPAGSFTEEQIALLKSEPLLVVHEGSAVSADVQGELLDARSRIIDLEAGNAALQEKLTAATQLITDLTAERDRLLADAAAKVQDNAGSSDNDDTSPKAKK
ncbi:HI1506-related protein [Phytobacter ursingii]|uniref:HI1506-related protein n=1 Tax=Phytobacter ursingii TaxID=1972431 RepID=UPI0031B7AD65